MMVVGLRRRRPSTTTSLWPSWLSTKRFLPSSHLHSGSCGLVTLMTDLLPHILLNLSICSMYYVVVYQTLVPSSSFFQGSSSSSSVAFAYFLAFIWSLITATTRPASIVSVKKNYPLGFFLYFEFSWGWADFSMLKIENASKSISLENVLQYTQSLSLEILHGWKK